MYALLLILGNVLQSQLGDRFLIKIFVFSWQQFEEEMKGLIFILLLITFIGCQESILQPEFAQRGVVVSFGNEPFTEIGIRISDEDSFLLKASPEILKEVSKHQGDFVTVIYSKVQKNDFGIKVLDVKKIIY